MSRYDAPSPSSPVVLESGAGAPAVDGDRANGDGGDCVDPGDDPPPIMSRYDGPSGAGGPEGGGGAGDGDRANGDGGDCADPGDDLPPIMSRYDGPSGGGEPEGGGELGAGIEQMETVEIVPTPGMIYHPSYQDMMDLLVVENLKGGDKLEGARWAPAQVPIQRGQSLL